MNQNKTNKDVDFEDQFSQAKSFALKFLANSEKTCLQMENFLVKKSFPELVIKKTLEYLEQQNLLNDTVFAQRWVEQRHRTKSFSPIKLQQELTAKGVSQENIVFALNQISSEQESLTVNSFIKKNLHKTKHLDHVTRVRRLVLMLAYRGYSESFATKSVLNLLEEEKHF